MEIDIFLKSDVTKIMLVLEKYFHQLAGTYCSHNIMYQM